MSIRLAFLLTLTCSTLLAADRAFDGEFVIHKNSLAPERLNFANHLWNSNAGWAAGTVHRRRGMTPENRGLDDLGYPVLEPGAKATTQLILPKQYANVKLLIGRMTITWRGDASIALSGGARVIESSDHRLEVDVSATFDLTITAGKNYKADPIRHLRVWAPDPQSPAERSLAPETGKPEPVIHPTYIKTWKIPGISVWRVAFSQFNNNPQEEWGDNRHPDHCFMKGSIKLKQVPGRGYGRVSPRGEVPWVHCIRFVNDLDSNIWVNIPHAATDAYIRDFAHALLYGCDKEGNPVKPGQKPSYAPLKAGKQVYVELSNEMWHCGYHQGIWAAKGAKELGIPWGAYPAKRSVEIWSLFQEEFERAKVDWRKRLVRVAACSGNRILYTQQYLKAAFEHGKALPNLHPRKTIGGSKYKLPSQPDVLTTANYFGNSISFYAIQMSKAGSKHPFWQKDDAPVQAMIREWNKRLMVGTKGSNWVNSTSGIIEPEFVALAEEYDLPLIGYEGGHGGPELRRKHAMRYPSLAVVGKREPRGPDVVEATLADHAARVAREAGVKQDVKADFMKFMRFRVMESKGMEQVMRLQLELLKANGMRLPCNSGEIDNPAIMNDWGLTEYLAEPLETAPRLRAVVNFVADHQKLNEVGESNGKGGAPRFRTSSSILVRKGRRIKGIKLKVKGGDAPLKIRTFGWWLPEGLKFNAKTNTISGKPKTDEAGHIFARVQDADGDIAYRKFLIQPVDRKLGRPVWRETFDNLPQGATKDTGSTAWTLTSEGAIIKGKCKVNRGMLEGVGVQGPSEGEFIWRTEPIDISRFKNVNLRIVVNSNNGPDRLGDWLRISYSIDGGEKVKIADFSGSNAIVKDPIINARGLAGKKIVIEARMTNSNTEMYGISEVGVFAP